MTGAGSRSYEVSVPADVAVREVRRLRKFGLKAPRDHVITSVIRILVLSLPVVLFLLNVFSARDVIVFLLGLGAIEVFNDFAKPSILTVFGPPEFKTQPDDDMAILIEDSGLSVKVGGKTAVFAWATVSVVPMPKAVIFRVGPERSVLILDVWLTADADFDCLLGDLETWTGKTLRG